MIVFCRCFLLVSLVVWSCALAQAQEPAKTGPETEKRFPPLKVPAGFKATLFACDPLIEYPSVISAGPRPGAIFVAIDYMTGLGTEITRRSEVRLVEDTNGDGYADKATVFAGGFNSIMGLAWQRDMLYVMHAPFLTALRDTRGAGVADERKDIVTGLGLTPEENPVRLHCANGVTVGHDGWLYLSLGDHGCKVQRPEGDQLVLEGGGILRCRSDGSDLHIFSTGLRNIYDVALDAELNVLVRDNENDGGDYKIRVCHSFFGADHGYPYLYYERPAEALRPIADLGLGSSAGGACYLERQFPAEYRGNLFFCEWGKSLVHYPLRREGSTFTSPTELEFASSAAGDPYGFKPTDVVVQRDGTLMISDYADGQRPMRGRGRIYHVAYQGDTQPATPRAKTDIEQLNSDSYVERCAAQEVIERAGESGLKAIRTAVAENRLNPRGRLHAIWILVRLLGDKAIEPLLTMAKSDAEPSVRAQAVRAIADLSDPILAKHRLDAGAGDPELAARLAALAERQDARVTLEVIIALSRLRWSGTPAWLKANLVNPDVALTHTAMQALRQSRNWKAALPWLDAPSDDPLRGIALRAMSRQYESDVVAGLIERLAREKSPDRAFEYAESLAWVYKKPSPWVYWDYRPKPRPVNPIAWERTEAIAAALNGALAAREPELRVKMLKQMQRETVPVSLEALGRWLQDEREPARVAVLLESLRDLKAADSRRHMEAVIRDTAHTTPNRLTALALLSREIDKEQAPRLLAMIEELEDGPVLAEGLRSLGKYSQLPSVPLLVRKLESPKPEVRAAALETLAELRAAECREPLLRLLADHESIVRRAAATAAGKLNERRAIEPLLKLAADQDEPARQASLDALRMFKEPRAVPLAVEALKDHRTELVALQILKELAGPEQTSAVADLAKRSPSLEVLSAAIQTLTTWQAHRAVAEIQGTSGSLVRWQVSGPLTSGDVPQDELAEMRFQFAAGTEGRLTVAKGVAPGNWFQAQTEIFVEEPLEIELLGSSSGPLQLWVNGELVNRRDKPQTFRVDSDRSSASLAKGNNRVVVLVKSTSTDLPVEFHARFRRKSAVAEHEKLLQAAISRSGSLERGRTVFLNTEKSLCLKCHRLGELGERTGPELSGLGSRFSRIYIAESILQPSRAIAPSFGTVVVALKDGKILAGVKVAETDSSLTLVDNQGNKFPIAKGEIEEQATSSLSTMPEGLEKRLTADEFVDLVAYLASLKENAK